jgi:hypothetical protein
MRELSVEKSHVSGNVQTFELFIVQQLRVFSLGNAIPEDKEVFRQQVVHLLIVNERVLLYVPFI